MGEKSDFGRWQRKKYTDVGEHFIGKHNVIYERARFNSRYQQQGETVENFITDVHKLAEHCQYGVLLEEMIRDRIVVGIRDAKLSEKLQVQLQLHPNLTLVKTITQVRQNEEVKNNSHWLGEKRLKLKKAMWMQ